MSELIIGRHGQSAWNEREVWTGIVNVGLTEKGFDEARKIGRILSGRRFDRAYVSELARTWQTLKTIKQVGKIAVPVTVAPALNERHYGELTGKSKAEVISQLGEEAVDEMRYGWDTPIPGGETIADVHGRVVPFFENEIVPALEENENIIMVTSAHPARLLAGHIEGLELEEIEKLRIANGQIIKYEFDDGLELTDKQVIKP